MKPLDSSITSILPSCKQPALTSVTGLLVFFYDKGSCYVQLLEWLRATDAALEAIGVHHWKYCVLWMRASHELQNVYECAFFAAREPEGVSRGYTILYGFADYNRFL